MNSKLAIGVVVSALVGLSTPAFANSKSDCAAGAIIGGVIGGIIGNNAGNGNDGSTIAGAGVGAIVGGAIACDRHGRRQTPQPQPPPHGDYLPTGLMDRTLAESFNYRVGRTIERQNNRGAVVQVTTYNENWYRRGTLCRDYNMTVWPAYGRSEYFNGTICQDGRGNVFQR